MEKKEQALLYGALLIGTLVLSWNVMSIMTLQNRVERIDEGMASLQDQIALIGYGTGHSQERYEAATESENATDPCATPEGYSDEAWIEHMSHHPDNYNDCL